MTARQLALAAGLLLALAVGAAALTVAPPVSGVSCPGSWLPVEACEATVDAAMRRGLPRPHPLILAARVAPGPAAVPGSTGHRATVTFGLLAWPGTVDVRLYYDMGGHWGGTPDRSGPELAAWWALPSLVLLAAAGLLLVLALRARRTRASRSERS